MAIADWIREATVRRREWWRLEDQATAYERKFAAACEKARQGGYLKDFQEIYNLGYVDAKSKKPYRMPRNKSDGLSRPQRECEFDF